MKKASRAEQLKLPHFRAVVVYGGLGLGTNTLM